MSAFRFRFSIIVACVGILLALGLATPQVGAKPVPNRATAPTALPDHFVEVVSADSISIDFNYSYDSDGNQDGGSSSSSNINFPALPVLPDGATIKSARLLIKDGQMRGNQFHVELIDAGTNQTIDQYITYKPPTPEGLGKYKCFDLSKDCSAVLLPKRGYSFEIPIGVVQNWYAQQSPAASLVLGPDAQGFSTCDMYAYVVTNAGYSQGCALVADAGVELQIEYDPLTLSTISKTRSAVPSEQEGNLTQTHHEYLLPDPAVSWEWTALASAQTDNVGNIIKPNRTTLSLLHDGIDDISGAIRVNQDPNDNTSNHINALAIYGAFNNEMGVVENRDGATDDVDLVYASPTDLPTPTEGGVSSAQPLADQLANLYQFNVPANTNLYIKATAPSDIDLEMHLFAPHSLTGERYVKPENAIKADYRPIAGGLGEYVMQGEVESLSVQKWGLLLTHDFCIDPGRGAMCSVDFELIACPQGKFYSERFDGCQPLIFPHPSLNGGTIPATPFKTTSDNMRIFSEGGFDENPSAIEYGGSYDYCTTDEAVGMPLLGTSADTISSPPSETLIAVLQGSVCVTDAGAVEIISVDGFGAMVGPAVREPSARIHDLNGASVNVYFGKLFTAYGSNFSDEKMTQDANNKLRFNGSDAALWKIDPWKNDWPSMTANPTIDVQASAVIGNDSGTVPIDMSPDVDNVNLNASWQIGGNFANQDFDFSATSGTALPNFEFASLQLRPHAPFDLQTAFSGNAESARVTEMHLTDATIHQSADLGSAYLPIQAIVLPVGVERSQGEGCGNNHCFDARNADNISDRNWEMPDIHIQENAGRIVVERAGRVDVFSADHPDSEALRAATGSVEAEFDFETFDGEVFVGFEDCDTEDGVDEEVLVIRGSTSIALPALADENADGGGGPGISSTFKLCKNALYEVSLTFDADPPGIPVGSTGLVLTELGGSVKIVPNQYAIITVNVAFKMTPEGTLEDIQGSLTIDTRGMFEIEGGAELVGTFDLSGSISVAWSPIDVLLQVNLELFTLFDDDEPESVFKGSGTFHMWRGQGWGDPAPYPWLPDDNDIHFTGIIEATILIKKGQIGEYFKMKLPRKDIDLQVEFKFGEFCGNDDCSQLIWGVQGKVKILKVTVGVFIGTRGNKLIGSGIQMDFFMGDKGMRLIDEATGSRANVPNGLVSSLKGGDVSVEISAESGCPTENDIATCTFSLDPTTEEVLFSIGWSEGTLPQVSLFTPSDKDVLAEFGQIMKPGESYEFDLDGASYAFAFDATGAIITILNPEVSNSRPSDYYIKIGGIDGESESNYNVFYFENSAAPTLNLTAPNNVTTSTTLDIDWTSSADNTIPLDLFYVTEADFLATPNPPTFPISMTMDATTGSYTWQPIGLASGDYRIKAQLQHPIHGVISAFSPGTFTYQDTTPPAVPSNITIHDAPDGHDDLIVMWTRNSEADLAWYEVFYTAPSLDEISGLRDKKITAVPSDPVLAHPTHEQARLGSLIVGTQTTLCVRAVDASGNVSACSADFTATPNGLGATRITTPTLNAVQVAPNRAVEIDWKFDDNADGYLLGWGSGCNATYSGVPADEGRTNLNVGGVGSFTLNGLPAGTYRMAVRAYTGNVTTLSAWSSPLSVVLTDGVDSNLDGLPDDWADVYGISGGTLDFDGDNLTNAQELANLTDPTRPDSDGDGFGDGDEVNVAGTDPCLRGDYPETANSHQLVVYPLVGSPVIGFGPDFDVATNDVFGTPVSYNIGIQGTGSGVNWTATASDSWIALSTISGTLIDGNDPAQLDISVNATGLAAGFYSGSITIDGTSSDPLYNAPRTIPVRMWVQREVARPSTSLSGLIFDDTNGDGDRDSGEDVVRDATLLVLDGNGFVVAEILVETDGTFDLSALPYATYRLIACRSVCDGDIPDGSVEIDLTVSNNTETGLEIPFVDSIPLAVGLQTLESDRMTMNIVWMLLALSAMTGVVWHWRWVVD